MVKSHDRRHVLSRHSMLRPCRAHSSGLAKLGLGMLALALLLAEALVIARRFRRTSPPLWRRKLVLLPATRALPAVLLAFQVWSLYSQSVAAYGPSFAEITFTSAPDTPLDNAISGAAWLCGMLIFTGVGLLAAGAGSVLAAD
jgi:hypothetical protein